MSSTSGNGIKYTKKILKTFQYHHLQHHVKYIKYMQKRKLQELDSQGSNGNLSKLWG